ncbi:hypothetical protein PEBR_03642 [Penicillium brasilianum]|uniref:Uncharacterized protein n=1 Tax=Penicillium brasilianum TaxID=104259 RepID=A0A1S9RYF1_PENBI|nr:hypothetical protein PEBR_03642 [Penicillium brasilianum]
MPRVKDESVWQWYASFDDKSELDLPDIQVESNDTYRLYCGELFCRAPGCPQASRETSLNNLRKHYARKHGEIKLTVSSSGGRYTLQEEVESIEFYKQIRQAYNARPKPTRPLKEDGSVHLTNARRFVLNAGGQIPCEPCKDADDPNWLHQNGQPSLEQSEAIFPVPSPPQQQRLEVTRGEVFQSQLPTDRSTVNAFKVVMAPKWLTHPCSVTTSSDIM